MEVAGNGQGRTGPPIPGALSGLSEGHLGLGNEEIISHHD